MSFLQPIIFSILLIVAIYFFIRSVKRISFNINLGQEFNRSDRKSERIKKMLLVAFGQKKMFKRPIPALLHLMVYVGFLIVNIELLEIVIDGITGKHRTFQPFLGALYTPLINFFEFFAVLVIISCAVFLIRRNITKVNRFHLSEMKKWPKLDANLILIFEIVLMIFLLNMNATDTVIVNKSGGTQSFFFSNLFVPVYQNFTIDSLHVAERIFWWAHIIGIFLFANYVPYSKHLHIFLAFPNTYFSNLRPKGEMGNMPSITNEVKIMLGLAQADTSQQSAPVASFGAKDVTDLSKKNILDAYACSECGRCTDSCPANMTGKKLSPRKIMMDTRDRAEELGKIRKKEGSDSSGDKSLLGDYITSEELFACTSCNACVEACPINIDPLSIIYQLRRYKAMEEAQGPNEWNGMYQNLETTFNPWKFPPTDRGSWTQSLNK